MTNEFKKQYTYHDKKVIRSGTKQSPHVEIDGKDVEVEVDNIHKQYTTVHLPYRTYKSLDELVQNLIDFDPLFKRKTRQPRT